jgi:HK97 family phage major capsid protein
MRRGSGSPEGRDFIYHWVEVFFLGRLLDDRSIPGRMLGASLYEASGMDGAIATGDDDVLLYGNFERYVIYDRAGASLEYIPHLLATNNNRPSGQRGWYLWWRVGANATDTNAFRILRV